MGYATRGGSFGHSIQTFTPDDTDTKIYISADSSIGMNDLLDKAREKWPGCSLGELEISAEHIHTDCLGYDHYDPFDYTNYIVIELKI